ncbi:hypothetical protein FRC07_000097 [Ceratobasidium sp. 392]|nr:hypothetical protein FRC07_000097 [Ceratobasidium sp. 392]
MFQSQHASTSQPNAFTIDSLNQEPKYVPGYLLSTTQGKSVAGFSNYNNPPLLPEPVSRDHGSAAPFGTGSLYSRPPPKSRDRTAPIVDNDAPPTESLLDGSNFNFSHQQQAPHSSRGLAITNAPSTNQAPTSLHSHTGGVALTVSGFYPDRAHGVAAQFVAIGDCSPPEMAPEGGNWFKIVYVNPWDAARAVRRDGDIINGDMMIAVRLVDPSQASLFNDAMSPHVPISSSPPEFAPKSPVQTTPGGFPTFGRAATLAPAASAFRSTAPVGAQSNRPRATAAPGADWGVRNQGETQEAQPQQQGIIGKVSDLIFGW